MTTLSESSLEYAPLGLLRGQGYAFIHGPEIDPDKPSAERTDWNQTTLDRRLRDALHRINPGIPTAAIEEAFRTLTTIDTPALIDRNHAAHWHLVNGISAEYLRPDADFLSVTSRAAKMSIKSASWASNR